MATAATLNTKALAEKLGTDPKTLRKFLRSHFSKDSLPGQGGRYEFKENEISKLETAFKKWNTGKAAKTDEDGDKDKPTAGRKDQGKKAKTRRGDRETTDADVEAGEVEEDIDEPDDDELEEEKDKKDEGPTDEDLDQMLAELDDQET